MCHVCDVMCVCRVCSPLCHEEVAPAQQPRWLQLRGQRLPQSQPVCGGNWGRASGTTSTPEDSQTLPQCFAFFSSSACKFDNHATTSPLPLTAHWSVVSPAYCRQRRGRQAMTRTTLRATCCCLLEWLFAGPHCHWRCTEPRTFPRVRWLTSDRPLKISSSSLEIRCGVVAAMQSELWWNLPLTFPPVDDAFVQSIKDMFGGEGSKKNLVDPFLEARFAGRKVPKTNTTSAVTCQCILLRSRNDLLTLCIFSCARRSSRRTQTRSGTSYWTFKSKWELVMSRNE